MFNFLIKCTFSYNNKINSNKENFNNYYKFVYIISTNNIL